MADSGSRVLIDPQQNETGELPMPNLTPRHRELIPTPLGPIKPWSELPKFIKVYFCLAIVSLLCVLALTIYSIVLQKKEGFTVSLIQLIGVVFCIYYVTRGILQENRQELIVFVLSVLLLMVRSIVNFTVITDKDKIQLLPGFVMLLLVGLFHVICAVILIQSPNMMAFRVGGALESLQSQYFMLNLCFSMLTFDLQAQLCLCVLLLTSGLQHISELHSIILGIGVAWAFLKVVIGTMAILKEMKPLVWIFVLQNLPEVAYLVYLLYTVISSWGHDKTHILEAAAVTGSCISVTIKSVLFWSLYHVYRSFGQGLRERMFSSYGRIDS
ncbi:uncharacterized protein LOC144754527 [Lissotriton helveticus]